MARIVKVLVASLATATVKPVNEAFPATVVGAVSDPITVLPSNNSIVEGRPVVVVALTVTFTVVIFASPVVALKSTACITRLDTPSVELTLLLFDFGVDATLAEVGNVAAPAELKVCVLKFAAADISV